METPKLKFQKINLLLSLLPCLLPDLVKRSILTKYKTLLRILMFKIQD